MATKQEHALFSYLAYEPSDANNVLLPSPWTPLEAFTTSDALTGFGARVFRNTSTNEYAIAFRETDFPEGLEDWVYGNAPGATGLRSAQIEQAIKLVADVQHAIAESGGNGTVTVTGHSLGGGIASVVSVFFDLQANVFATAPFEESAVDRPFGVEEFDVDSYFDVYNRHFFDQGYQLSGPVSVEFQSYRNAWESSATSGAVEFATRQERVTNWYVPGEAVQLIRTSATTITGVASDIPFPTGVISLPETPEDAAVALHSIQLHAALTVAPQLSAAIAAVPTLVEQMLSENLFAANRSTTTSDFLVELLKEFYTPSGPISAIERFSLEAAELTGTGALSNSAIQRGIVATLIEYYNYANYANQAGFVVGSGDRISFDTERFTSLVFDSRGGRGRAELSSALWAMLTPQEGNAVAAQGIDGRNWTVQRGITGIATTASISDEVQLGSPSQSNNLSGGLGKDLLVGGSAADTVNGGMGDDILVGGAGVDSLSGGDDDDSLFGGSEDDTLEGGAGSDRLYGGAGNDTYILGNGSGADSIEDVDGQLVINGAQFTGSSLVRVGDDAWRDAGSALFVSRALEVTGSYTVVIRDAAATFAVTIKGWGDGYLGFSLLRLA